MQFNLRSTMLGSIILALMFFALIPITEWPDASVNISRASDGSKLYPINSAYLSKIIDTKNLKSGEIIFFQDNYATIPKIDYLLANLTRLPIVIFMIIAAHLLAKKFYRHAMPLTPPLIFSLCSPSQEAIAIFTLICAFIIANSRKAIAVLLCIFSVALDRSMAPNAVFLALIIIFAHLYSIISSPKCLLAISLILIFLTKRYEAIDIFNAQNFSQLNILGITHFDILYNANFGKNNLYALASSLMGLYGWMSIRPFPFWIYYPVIAILFMIGFIKSDWCRRSLFLSLLLVSYLTMWLLPPMSQARYYPLLTISFWSIAFSGVQTLKINSEKFHIFILMSTFAGCLAALFKNYAYQP